MRPNMSPCTSWGMRHVDVAFGKTFALHDVSFSVDDGEILAIVGGDGAGKSTLLQVLAGRRVPSNGTVTCVSKNALGMQPAASGVWPNLTMNENIAFVEAIYRSHAHPATERLDVTTLVQSAGLGGAEDRLGRALSGGMRQKLGVILAAAHASSLLLLDEPSTGVDPVSRVELWKLITGIAHRGTAVVFSTTYLDEAARAERLIMLDEGSIIAEGRPETLTLPGRIVESRRPHDDTKLSWQRGNVVHTWYPAHATARALPQDGLAIAPDLEDIAITLTATRGLTKPARPLVYLDTDPSADRAARPGPAALTNCVELSNVTKRYGQHTAIDGVSFAVRPGQIVGLIGANGAGKTTTLRQLLGLETPTSGTVSLFDGAASRSSRTRIGYVPQSMGIFLTLTVDENVDFTATVFHVKAPPLPPFLAQRRHQLAQSLSLGEQRQLAFFLALLHAPELLVLDEPTSGVSPLARAALWETLHRQAAQGIGVLVTTHYLQEAEQCDLVIIMQSGRVVGQGTVPDLVSSIQVLEATPDNLDKAMAHLDHAAIAYTLTGRRLRIPNVAQDAVATILGAKTPMHPVTAHLDELLLTNAAAKANTSEATR